MVSLNLHRRHLNESQRAVVAAKITNLQHDGDWQRVKARKGPRFDVFAMDYLEWSKANKKPRFYERDIISGLTATLYGGNVIGHQPVAHREIQEGVKGKRDE